MTCTTEKGSRSWRKAKFPFSFAMMPKGDSNPHGFPHHLLKKPLSDGKWWPVPPSHPKSVKMSYGLKSGVLFIARIETTVTAIQNNDLIIRATMVRLSNAPPPIT